MNRLLKIFEQNKKQLFFVMICTFFWGMLAHGYGFMQNSFSHDSLNEFNSADVSNSLKIQLGRFIVPLYKAIFRTNLTLPWLIGVLALIWIGLSVFLIVKIFNIESRGFIFLVAGIFTANITVAALAATYMHDFDCNMFALFCAVMAVYFWKNVRWGGILGAICISLSLGIYQSYLSVTIVLVMFVCILNLMNGKTFKSVFSEGMQAIGMLLCGGVLYYIALKTALHITNISLIGIDEDYSNSLYRMFQLTPKSGISLILGVFDECYQRLMNVISPYPGWIIQGITFILFAAVIAAIIVAFCDKRIHLPEKLLLVVLMILLPPAMNLSYILSVGISHDLMVYAVWLFYLLALLLVNWLERHLKNNRSQFIGKGAYFSKYICMLLTFTLLYSNVQLANVLYLKKDQEQDAYLSLMTRVVYKMESFDRYLPGTTPVVFIGLTDQLNETIPGFEEFNEITGCWNTDVLYTPQRERYQAYFDYILVNRIVLADDSIWKELQESPIVAQMPSYPFDGCIAMIDDVLVVKLGDYFS